MATNGCDSNGGGTLRPMRYAHYEGHTDLCYTDDGRYIITCGSDGEVRVFEGLDDDDCKTHTVADAASAIAYRDGRFLVGVDDGGVQAFTLSEGTPDTTVTRFTTPATHISVRPGGKTVACAGSDMAIHVTDPDTHREDKLLGHKAPVLSVAMDPKGKFVASSSCDGSVRVWDLATRDTKTSWDVLTKSSSFEFAESLCRLAFSPSGQVLAVPLRSKIMLYERDDFRAVGDLSSEKVQRLISVVAFSPCGTFITAGCVDGTLAVWRVESRVCVAVFHHPKCITICGVAWNPKEEAREFAFVDVAGQLGTVVDVVQTPGEHEPPQQIAPEVMEVEEEDSKQGDEGEEEEEEFSISRIKATCGFLDDEEGSFVGLPPTTSTTSAGALGVGEGASSRPGTPSAALVPVQPQPRGPPQIPVTKLQQPFQPGMTPEHLTHRFMVWNNVGVIRQYNDEDENRIDVEFHDTTLHHSIFINNTTAGYNMAALSSDALVLAADGQDGGDPSKLTVRPLQGGKEWHLDMPQGEDIAAIGVGGGWIAVATEGREVRVFGVCGSQREVWSLPGPVVCLAGWRDKLLVVFHSGVDTGILGDQHMSYYLLPIPRTPHHHHHKTPPPQAALLPLTPRSFLAWGGFTDEGTPLTMDSSGVVRLMNREPWGMWTPVLNTRDNVSSSSDHYFLIGGSELESQVRCILCRGVRYPPVMPRPHCSLLDMKIPVMEAETDKGKLEETTLRNRLILGTLRTLGEAVEGEAEESVTTAIRQSMVKLFALSCLSERECRAVEVSRLMGDRSGVEMAMAYASRKHHRTLVERLGAVMREEEEHERKRRQEEEEEERGRIRYVPSYGTRGGGEEEEEEFGHTMSSHQEEEEEGGAGAAGDVGDNPFVKAMQRRDSEGPHKFKGHRNPFKKPDTSPSSSSSSSSRGCIGTLDSIKKTSKKDYVPILRPVMRRPPKRQQQQSQDPPHTPNTTTTPPKGKENTQNNNNNNDDNIKISDTKTFSEMPVPSSASPAPLSSPSVAKHPSALQLWMDENRGLVKAAHPEAKTEKELFIRSAVMFRSLDPLEKQKYKDMADNLVSSKKEEEEEEGGKGRKRSREEEEEEEEKKKRLDNKEEEKIRV